MCQVKIFISSLHFEIRPQQVEKLPCFIVRNDLRQLVQPTWVVIFYCCLRYGRPLNALFKSCLGGMLRCLSPEQGCKARIRISNRFESPAASLLACSIQVVHLLIVLASLNGAELADTLSVFIHRYGSLCDGQVLLFPFLFLFNF